MLKSTNDRGGSIIIKYISSLTQLQFIIIFNNSKVTIKRSSLILNKMKKKSLLTIIFFTGAIVSNAQITVTQADIAPIGKQIQQATDTTHSLTPGSINPGNAGTNQTWNFTTLLSDTLDTLLFTNPAWTPYASTFPSSNLALITSSSGQISYAENLSIGLFVDGAYLDPLGTGPIPIKINPPEQIIKFPDAYNTTFQGTTTIDVTIAYSGITGVDSVRLKEVKDKSSLTDGWGSVITPLGTYPSLRHKDMVIKTDSTWARFFGTWMSAGAPTIDTAWHFSWIANNVGYPLLEFDSIHGDTIQNITWLKVLPVIGGIKENTVSNDLSVFPNPSSGLFTIESKQENIEKAEVYNLFGVLIYSESKPAKSLHVDLTTFSSGMYYVKVFSLSGTIVKPVIINK